MTEFANGMRRTWENKVRSQYPKDIPTPDRTPNTDGELLRYLADTYADTAARIAGIPALKNPEDTLAPGDGYVALNLGVHRQSESVHSGQDRTVNLHPQRLLISPEDARMAEVWAIEQMKHYPTEENAARRLAGTHGLVVRVEWGADSKQPYEVDTEPSGFGMLQVLSPAARAAIINHRAALGLPLWTYTTEDRLTDTFEDFAAPVCLPGELGDLPSDTSGLLLPFMRDPDCLPPNWHGQSILPVKTMEDKSHQALMGLARIARSDAEKTALLDRVNSGSPVLARQLVGSCATGLVLYGGSGGQKVALGSGNNGLVTKSKTIEFISQSQDAVLWRPFVAPGSPEQYGIQLTAAEIEKFGPPSKLNAIRRYFVLVHPNGDVQCVGGFTTIRKNAKVHGADDAIMVVCDPPLNHTPLSRKTQP